MHYYAYLGLNICYLLVIQNTQVNSFSLLIFPSGFNIQYLQINIYLLIKPLLPQQEFKISTLTLK